MSLWAAYDPSAGELAWILMTLAVMCPLLARWKVRVLSWRRWLRVVSCYFLIVSLVGLAYWPLTATPPFAFLWVCLPLELALLLWGISVLPPRGLLVVASLALTSFPCVAWLAYQRPYLVGPQGRGAYLFGPPLGYRPHPGARLTLRKVRRGQQLYRVEYGFDPYGRRCTPPASRASQELLCFGCSVTFGEGVEDHQAWPSVLALRRPDVSVYNYALSGYGPAQMLDQIRSKVLKSEVGKGPYRACYFLQRFHDYRVSGHPYVVGGWGGGFSRYQLQEGQLLRLGSFGETLTPWQFLTWYSLAGFGLHRYLAPPDDHVPEPEVQELVIALLGQAQRELHLQLGKCPLTVVVTSKFRWTQRLQSGLAEHGVELAQFPRLLSLGRIAGDGHPDAAGQAVLAEAIESALWPTQK